MQNVTARNVDGFKFLSNRPLLQSQGSFLRTFENSQKGLAESLDPLVVWLVKLLVVCSKALS